MTPAVLLVLVLGGFTLARLLGAHGEKSRRVRRLPARRETRPKRLRTVRKGRSRRMASPKRAFISFDYDHDEDLRNLLVGQAKNPDTPFQIVDRSVKEPLTGDWKAKVKGRIQNVDVVIVICGQYMSTAMGVNAEIQIAQEIGKPYFLLWGRNGKTCTKPSAAKGTDTIYEWTWPALKTLIGRA
jgi:hypothetical protein